MPPQLEGRAFSRLQQYATLPEELQNEIKALELHLTEHQAEVFGPHHANIIKTVRSVRAKPLLEKIVAWLNPKAPATEATADATTQPEVAPTESNQTAEQAPTEAAPIDAAVPVAAPVEATQPAPTTAEETKPAESESKPTADDAAAANFLAHAKQLLEGLVLHGFITPNKEQERLPTATNTPGSLVFKDSELFVPLANAISDNTGPTTTVWQVVEGATFAGFVKRKAGFLAPITQGKDAYLVANSTLKTLTFFDSDVGRAPVAQFEAAATNVSFDKSHFVHGIKIWNETTTEMINTTNKLEREALVQTLVSLGLQYREEPTIDMEKVTSIYQLKDVDIDGNEVVFETYKGKVLLVVNVSSACGLTPTNYPELAALDAKYREQGLQVLAFPCNQFGGQEPGTHEEIKTFVQQYNVEFPLFAKGDVNGVETRPLFSYLKSKLAGPDGTYVRWNFTKFLVDRNGVPVKRFGPMELPLSFESEIVTLLFQQPEAVVVETNSESVETNSESVETKQTEVPVVVTETVVEPVVVAPAVSTPEPVVAVVPTPEPVVEQVVAAPEPVAAPAAAAAPVTESVAKSDDAKTIETVTSKVTTLSVESHPVEETQQVTKTEAVVQEAAAPGEVVPGFTPGNDPSTIAP